MAYMALLPLAAVAYAAYRLVRWAVLRGREDATLPAPAAMCAVQIERGSVHASDDAPSRQLRVPADSTMRDVISNALADGYLPRVSGDRATWEICLLETSGADGSTAQALAVWSQQWPEPAFVIDPDQPLATFAVDGSMRIRCVYRGVEDPGEVLDERLAACPMGAASPL